MPNPSHSAISSRFYLHFALPVGYRSYLPKWCQMGAKIQHSLRKSSLARLSSIFGGADSLWLAFGAHLLDACAPDSSHKHFEKTQLCQTRVTARFPRDFTCISLSQWGPAVICQNGAKWEPKSKTRFKNRLWLESQAYSGAPTRCGSHLAHIC